jgi:nucleoid DNA-binding protein
MQMDVGAYIAELLYEHDSVNIPGLGGFLTRYKPAEIDQVQGKLHPPAKSLEFNENLRVNDGVLVNYIKEKHNLSLQQAEEAVHKYVQGVKNAIGQREIVVFPRVGRLYKDYEQKLQFLPDNTNFNTDAFGLPTVQYYPAGQGATAASETTAAVRKQEPSQETSPTLLIASWFQKYLLVIASITVILVALGLFLFFKDWEPSGVPENSESNVPTSRLNTKPGMEEPAAGESREEGTNAPDEGEDIASLDDPEDIEDMRSENIDPGAPDTEASTPVPGRKFAVVAIGLFGRQENINKLTQEIYKAGYEPYLEEVGRLTRVGIQFPYEENAEVERELENIRDRFDPKAFVLKRGEEGGRN